MFIGIGVLLLIAWLLGLTTFHVAGGIIHILLILAVISVVVHFVLGRSAVSPGSARTLQVPIFTVSSFFPSCAGSGKTPCPVRDPVQ